jgi:hypothetical protein
LEDEQKNAAKGNLKFQRRMTVAPTMKRGATLMTGSLATDMVNTKDDNESLTSGVSTGASMGSQIGTSKTATSAPISAFSMNIGKGISGLETLEIEEMSNDDIIKNVEQMINQQQKVSEAAKTDKNVESKVL